MISRPLIRVGSQWCKIGVRSMSVTPQKAILDRDMGQHQWYLHLSRTGGANLNEIKTSISELRADCEANNINLTVAFGPTLLQDLTTDIPDDFQPYATYSAIDGSGKEAKGTQEELLFWLNSNQKDDVWKVQYKVRKRLEGHMSVARETMTFIYGNSLDLTGFIDGTGNPDPADDKDVAIVPDGLHGAGGSFIIAQRWVHDLDYFNSLSLADQEATFGRTKLDSTRLEVQPPQSHLSHVELRQGQTGDDSTEKRDQISRRSTPYAFHDGSLGLYFLGFCNRQAPLRERMEAIYGINGQQHDALIDYSTPASGAFYFAPSTEMLDSL